MTAARIGSITELLNRLIEWAEQMGGWEAPIWQEVEAIRDGLQNRPEPSSGNEIKAFLHCGECLREKPPNVSPAEYARIEVGWTPIGFQAWCTRHNANILHVDFEGCQHPANTRRPKHGGGGGGKPH